MEEPMKTERITILADPQFKSFLSAEAARENVSVAELVRTRCEQRPTEDMKLLKAMTKTLRANIAQAKHSLREGLDDAHSILTALKLKRHA
jgi:hypothetical protein